MAEVSRRDSGGIRIWRLPSVPSTPLISHWPGSPPVMSYHLASASLRCVPFPPKKPPVRPSGPGEGGGAPMQAHGVKSQTASQIQDGEQPALGPGPRLLPWLPWDGGAPSWMGCSPSFHPGVTTLPQTKDEEEALQSQALHSLSSWVLSRSVRYQPSG